MHADWIIDNVRIATCQESLAAQAFGVIDDGLLAVKGDKILWLGEKSQAPSITTSEHINGNSGWLTPGLIDCHTHLVYAGQRANEFALRQQGVSYADIARHGGGIMSTVRATRQANFEQLQHSALTRLQRLCEEGVTTIEIKSGYGLDLETELRMLAVARSLADVLPVTVQTSYLGAHALAPEFQENKEGYVDLICHTALPQIAAQKLADAIDVFCETIGFTQAQCQRIFSAASRLGLRVKAHAEQLSYQGGANLVAEFSGLSADHLEYLPESDIAVLKAKHVVAVLLPAAFYYLHEKQLPPIKAMREYALPMAVASDCNPGSAPVASLLTAMNQACVLFGLTPEEALIGVTRHAAQALGIHATKGQLKAGYDADILLWHIEHPAELSYSINMHRPSNIWKGGTRV